MNHDALRRAESLSDRDLLVQLKVLVHQEREVTVALIAHLAVLDERGLHFAEGYSSLFSYCTQALHLSEHAAFGRIAAARAARRFPILLEMVAGGALTLTTLGLLAPHLTPANQDALLAAARHKSKRQVEQILADLHPLPGVPSTIRRLPLPVDSASPPTSPVSPPPTSTLDSIHSVQSVEPSVASDPSASAGESRPPDSLHAPPRAAAVTPLGLKRYRVQFTATAEFCDKLCLAQDLLRHQIPDGDLTEILDRALTVLLESLAKERFATTDRPRRRGADQGGGSTTVTRHIPAEVKRAVWLRDGGRCAFVGHSGRRCSTRGFLEFHHIVPYAEGGEATVKNIELRCRAHNQYEAALHFGEDSDPTAVPFPGPVPRTPLVSRLTPAARAGPG
ncbi:MAG TPA: HNH endonuclease [bacterium]